MSVVAKFKVDEVKSTLNTRYKEPSKGHREDNIEKVEMQTIVMSPVYAHGDPNHENTKFWNATPSGRLELGTINPEAWQEFELGQEYYLTFTKA